MILESTSWTEIAMLFSKFFYDHFYLLVLFVPSSIYLGEYHDLDLYTRAHAVSYVRTKLMQPQPGSRYSASRYKRTNCASSPERHQNQELHTEPGHPQWPTHGEPRQPRAPHEALKDPVRWRSTMYQHLRRVSAIWDIPWCRKDTTALWLLADRRSNQRCGGLHLGGGGL